jgi:HSP20 family protein
MPTTLVPWKFAFPRVLSRFEREMEDLMERFWGTEMLAGNGEPFAPPVNVAETDKGYEVTFDLPGIDPKDLTVEVRDGTLVVGGERKTEKEEKGKTFHRVEKTYGAFRRVIPFDLPIDREHVEAAYRDGVLKVSLLKTAESRPKRIEVKA